ncbi:MAG: leucine-rich repeat domain-containing protein [Clostridia bacterium]|nr:leucine-rich repeat domain-containing protein [Clostridia bacterium]
MKTKKILFIFLAVFMLLAFSVIAYADSGEYGGQCGDNVTWSFDEETKTLTFSGTGGIWENYFPWKSIENVEAITFEDGITSIPNECFRGMESGYRVNLGNTLETIGDYAFYNNDLWWSVEIPTSVEYIGDYAFFGYTGSVFVYSRNAVIGEYALGCKYISDGIIDKNGAHIFGFEGSSTQGYAEQTGLNNFDILAPGSDADFTFDENTGTLNITGTGLIHAMSPAIGYWMGIQPEKIKHIVIGEGITEIADYTFGECGVQDIVLPSTLEKIGITSFAGCSKLKQIEFPAALQLIESNAFYGCISLEKVKFNGDTRLEYSAFRDCYSLKEVDFGVMTEISSASFNDCTALESLIIPDTVKTIGLYAFAECENLKNVQFGKSVETIGTGAFAFCRGLNDVIIPESVKSIGYNTFLTVSPTNVTVLSENTVIEPNAIGYITPAAEYFEIYYSLLPIRKEYLEALYSGNDELAEKLDKEIERITQTELMPASEQLYYTDSEDYKVLKAENYTVTGYTGSTAEKYAAENGFAFRDVEDFGENGQCGDNVYWTFDSKTGTLTLTGSGDMWEYEQGKNDIEDVIPWYESNRVKKLIIEDGITKIADRAICGLNCLEDVQIGNNVRSLGKGAFSDCAMIENVELPDSLEVIEDGSFSYSNSLKSLVIPESVKSMGSYILCDCFSLKSLVIPGSVKSIGDFTMYSTGIESLVLSEGVQSVGKYSIVGMYKLKELYIPSTIKSIETPFIMAGSPVALRIVNNSDIECLSFELCTSSYDECKYSEMLLLFMYGEDFNGFSSDDEAICAVNEKFGMSYKSAEEFQEDLKNHEYAGIAPYLTIECRKNSPQHEQCKTLGINHILTDSEFDCECGRHNVYTNEIMEPTCTENGYRGGIVCLECEHIFENAEVIPATGHSKTVIPGIAATCTKNGSTDKTVCEKCHAVLKAAETIPAAGHTDSNGDGICDVCNEKIGEGEKEPETIAERIRVFMKGIVNAILALFKKLFG